MFSSQRFSLLYLWAYDVRSGKDEDVPSLCSSGIIESHHETLRLRCVMQNKEKGKERKQLEGQNLILTGYQIRNKKKKKTKAGHRYSYGHSQM